MPRNMELSEPTVAVLSEADRALGRLAGAGRLLPNPHLLVNAYVRREAVASSRIEGIQASLSDLFDAEARGDFRDGDIQEVVNYIRAMETGLARLDQLPISRRLLEEIHRVLLSEVRGEAAQPGNVRTSPNWIGSPDNQPATAVFVPPPVDELAEGLADWERFVHEPLAMPPLIRCALMHYQFETLHPFLDGNGRLGRLLIVFFLVSEDLLPAPLLYLSSYFRPIAPSTTTAFKQSVRPPTSRAGCSSFSRQSSRRRRTRWRGRNSSSIFARGIERGFVAREAGLTRSSTWSWRIPMSRQPR